MKVEIDIDLTPDILAKMFVEWSDEEQANFLNLVGQSFKAADFSAETQCSYTADRINKDGRDFIFTLANFLKVRGVTGSSPKFGDLIDSYPTYGLF
jgi:hypothetical protein